MRILQVVTLLSPDGAFGGPARVALNQSAELLRRGHQVTLAGAARGYRELPTELNGVPVELYRAKTVLPRTGFAGVSAPGLRKWFHDNSNRFDVTHIHLGRDLVTLPLAAAARRRGVPYVLQTHGMVVPTDHPLAAPLDRVWTREILRAAQTVFYLNAQERERLVSVGGPALRLAELDNGVPGYPAPAAPTGQPEVLFAARMHARKRPVAFVEMAKELLRNGIDARFTLVGPDEGEGPAVRSALAGNPHITWEGALAPESLPARMAAADVYVLPSVREPYPMSVLEAMSVGVPVVVTTDCGLAPVVRRSDSGIVAEPTVAALAAAVDAILGDRGRARSMGEHGKETVHTQFGMPRVADRLLGAYADATGGHR